MKKIKFRLWFEGKMIYPHETHGAGSSAMQYTIDLSGNVDYRNVYGLDNEAVKNCDAAIKLQYTGLKDRNGKEIYEGDVVEFRANYSAKPCGWMSGVVLFENLQWGLKNEHGTYSIYDETDEFEGYKSEVIGNIYETPYK